MWNTQQVLTHKNGQAWEFNYSCFDRPIPTEEMFCLQVTARREPGFALVAYVVSDL